MSAHGPVPAKSQDALPLRHRSVIRDFFATERLTLDLMHDYALSPPGRPFSARYGVLPARPCRGATRGGQPCNAHPAIIGPSGYCHWHDPALAWERAHWRRRGPGYWGRLILDARAVISLGDGGRDIAANNPLVAEMVRRYFAQVAEERAEAERHDPATLRRLLAEASPGVRRVALALVADPGGRTYGEAAAALGVAVGTVRRQLMRLKGRHPEAHAAVLAVRADQLAERHARTEERRRRASAERRAEHRRRHGGEPWAR